jgi:pyruvate-formate lyase-activating enzyme
VFDHLTDKIQLLKKASPRRALNAFKVISSFYVSKILAKPIQWGLPLAVAIEPTTACNLGCPECPSGLRSFSRTTGNLKKEFYQTVIDQLAKDTFYLTFYFQGEPYINKDFLEMVSYAAQQKIYTATSTNADCLNDENARKTVESGLDRLLFPLMEPPKKRMKTTVEEVH